MAALFILVVLAGLSAFIVTITSGQNLALAQNMAGSRAYQAARAGAEWGIANWLNNAVCTDGTLSFTDPDLQSFTTRILATPSTGGGRSFCTIDATASPTGTSSGSLAFVERSIYVVIEGNQ